jgi:hypothetical protein
MKATAQQRKLSTVKKGKQTREKPHIQNSEGTPKT